MIDAPGAPTQQYVRCQGCDATSPRGVTFCESCGERMRRVQGVVNQRPARSQKPRSLGNHVDEEHAKHIKGARVVILIVAILTVIATAIAQSQLDSELQSLKNVDFVVDANTVSKLKLLIHAQYALAGLFVGLFFWAKRNAFAATLAALIIYVSSHLASLAVDPESIGKGLFVKILVVAALVQGVKAGLASRSARE